MKYYKHIIAKQLNKRTGNLQLLNKLKTSNQRRAARLPKFEDKAVGNIIPPLSPPSHPPGSDGDVCRHLPPRPGQDEGGSARLQAAAQDGAG